MHLTKEILMTNLSHLKELNDKLNELSSRLANLTIEKKSIEEKILITQGKILEVKECLL